jgi:transcriptional regulator with XRE-family HTH domain
MQQSGFTQAHVAEQLGVWDSLVSRWRKGGGINVENVRKLADLFGVDRNDLERLAGYSDNPLSSEETSKTEIDLERHLWRTRYDALMENKVPKWAWRAYMEACEALADAYTQLRAGELSTPEQDPLSSHASSSDTASNTSNGGDLTHCYRPAPVTYQTTKRTLVSVPG